MNDPKQALNKLEALLALTHAHRSDLDNASLYGAMRWLIADLDAHCEECCPYLLENVERARWSLAAILGYDITNGHSEDQHRVWALGAIHALRDKLVE